MQEEYMYTTTTRRRRTLPINPQLQYDHADILKLSAEYLATLYKGRTAADWDQEMEDAGRRIVNSAATRKNIEQVYRWKSHRRMDLFVQNADEQIAEAVTGAIAAKTPREAVESLTRLEGVGVKMASAILTSMFPELYTVCDFRASEAGVKDGNDVDFYVAYLDACRRMAKEYGVTLRDFDRANWQWSKNKEKDKERRARCCGIKAHCSDSAPTSIARPCVGSAMHGRAAMN
jgi:hypothetical protein